MREAFGFDIMKILWNETERGRRKK